MKLSTLYILNENIQLADKTYFNTGKLSKRVREIITSPKVTNGDAYTKLICDIYYTMLQDELANGEFAIHAIHNIGKSDEWNRKEEYTTKDDVLGVTEWKKLQKYYTELKNYNKNVFPIKDFNINGVKDMHSLMTALQKRAEIIETFKTKLPSIAYRNMKEDIRQERNGKEMYDYEHDLDYFMNHYSRLANRDETLKTKIINKMFKNNVTLDELLDFVQEKENLLGGQEFNKKKIISLIKENPYDLEKIYSKGDVMVIKVTDVEGIAKLGCNSLWCFTYGQGKNYRDWSNYSHNGIVYVIIDFSMSSDDKDFMHVLIKPIDFFPDENDEEANDQKLYSMDNQDVYDALSVITYYFDFDVARKLFNFDDKPQKNPNKVKKSKAVDPNQLSFSFESKLKNIFNEVLTEDFTLPNLRLANNSKISDKEKNNILNVRPEDLVISQGDFDGKIVNMNVQLPWDSPLNDGGIIADIQIVKDFLYQIHIQISDEARSLGLGFKTYVALVNDLGHLYSGRGRMHNTTEIPKIWSKLRTINNFECYQNERGSICILKNNPNKEFLLKVFNS